MADSLSVNLQVTAAYGEGVTLQENISIRGVNFFVGTAHGLGVTAAGDFDCSKGPEPKGFGWQTEGVYGLGHLSFTGSQTGLSAAIGAGPSVGFYFGTNTGYFSGRIPWSSSIFGLMFP